MKHIKATFEVDFYFDGDNPLDKDVKKKIQDAIKRNINGWQYNGSLVSTEVIGDVDWREAVNANKIYKEDFHD